MNYLIKNIVHCCKVFRNESTVEGCGFAIHLRNARLSQLAESSDLYASLFLRRGETKSYLERIPLQQNPDGKSVHMDFTDREQELAEGEWIVEEIEVMEVNEVVYQYEACRPIFVNWTTGVCYDWVVDNEWKGLGNGTKKDPYEVCSPRMLDRVRSYVNKSNVWFRQMCDIQLAGCLKISYHQSSQCFEAEPNGYIGNETGWIPIGLFVDTEKDSPFQGNYDGGGFRIDGLCINRPEGNVQGLFGIIEGESKNSPARLENIHVGKNSAIVGQAYLGSIVGNVGWAEIRNCINEGIVKGVKSVGGVAGAIIHTEISNCSNLGYVTGFRDCHEVIGRNAGGCKSKLSKMCG